MSDKTLSKKMIIRSKSVIRYWINATLTMKEVVKRWLASMGGAVDKKQFVICGYPRSGTSLLYNMVASSLQNFDIDEWETSALDSIWKYDNHASKSPVDLFQLEEIASKNIHDKEICVIVMVRDIRDIITSRHQFAPDSFVIGYQGAYSFSGEYPNYQKKFDGPGVGQYYSVMEKLLNNSSFNLLCIKYEDLVSDADKCQEKIANAFDVQFDGLFSSYHLRKERHKLKYEGKYSALDKSLEKSSGAVEKKYVKRWADSAYKERIKQQFLEYPQLFDILLEQGYQDSRDWFKEYE